jgi:hypothetical protein
MADYSINAVTRRVVYNGSSGLGPYAFSFEVLEQTDITVYFNATKLTLTTDYTVTVNANGTGSVTLIVATNVPQTPVTADQVVVVGARDLERVTDFVTAGDLRASALNEQLDSLVIFDQQVAEEAKRTMRAPVYDPALVEDGGTIDMELPTASSRAGKTLAFDGNGNPIVGEDIGNWRGDWAAGTAYTVRDIVRDASNYNIYRVNTSHTSSGAAPISTNADVAKWDLVIDASYAATQAANAAASATAAANSATAAATSETNAATSETNAASSASTATTKASEAATSATNAATSETNAAASETNAATSATNASSSASAASTSASASATSATASANSATAAATSETNAASSASSASTLANNAATSASNASNSASAAAASESNASSSATAAATSATNAATSATAASGSATAAANSAAAAAAAFDNFDDTYLGSFTADPTVDNDGDALVEGALYFNSTANEMRVYDGANWIAASSAGTASILEYNYTATAGQTTFTGSDDNSAALSYTAANLIVTLNGIVLENGTDYTASNGTSIVLTVGAAAGDEFNVIAFKSFTVSDTVAASTGGTFNGNVSVTGTVTADGLTLSSTSNQITLDTSDQTTYGRLDAGHFSNGAFIGTYAGTNAAANVMRFGTSGTERLRIDSNGNLQHLSKPAYFARSWVNFKGTGTVSIRESNNVSSVTDLGTGDYRVNFYTAMTDANYSMHFGGTPQNGRFLVNWDGTINNGTTAVVNSTSNCRIAMIDGGSGSRSDATNVYVSIFR